MKGFINKYTPEEVFEFYLETQKEEKEGWNFEWSWAYISQTQIRFRIRIWLKLEPEESFLHDKFIEEEFEYDEFIIEVPRTIDTEVWSQIIVLDDEIREVIICEDEREFEIDKGFETIMEKLDRNFKEGILDEETFKRSVRSLKAARLEKVLGCSWKTIPIE